MTETPALAALNLEQMMLEALEQARLAGLAGNLPIGAVVVLDGQIIGRGHNTCETGHNQILHAEINALNDASKKL